MSEIVTFSLPCLKKLVTTPNSCVFCESNFKRSLVLSPSHLTDIKKAVKESLASNATCYDIELKGIILSHKNIKIYDSITVNDDGSFKLQYVADIYIFRPTIGCKLSGKVNKKGKDVIGCLVHSAFNVAIVKPKGKKNLKWQGYELQIGQTVTFTVVKLDFSGRLPYIKGELVNAEEVTDDGIDSGIGNQEALNGGTKKKKYTHHELSKSFFESAGDNSKSNLGEFSGTKRAKDQNGEDNFSSKSKKRKHEPENLAAAKLQTKQESEDDTDFELIKETKPKKDDEKPGPSSETVKKHKKKKEIKTEVDDWKTSLKTEKIVESLIQETAAKISSPKGKKVKKEHPPESDESSDSSNSQEKILVSSKIFSPKIELKTEKKRKENSKSEENLPIKNLNLKDITKELIRNSLSSDGERGKDIETGKQKSKKGEKKEKKKAKAIADELLAQALSSL